MTVFYHCLEIHKTENKIKAIKLARTPQNYNNNHNIKDIKKIPYSAIAKKGFK